MYPRFLHIYGPLWINGYGLMIAIGFLLFTYLLYKSPMRSKLISAEQLFNLISIGLIAGIIGGRLFFVLSEFKYFSKNFLEIFYLWDGGFGILGTILAVLVVVFIYLKLHKITFLPLADLISIYAPLMQSISRLGCLFAGCCYGRVVSDYLPWAITFTNTDGLAPLNVALHPTQIYSSIASFLIFLFLYFRSKYFSFKKGEILFSYLLLESVSRFSVDIWRGDKDLVLNFPLAKDFFSLFSYSQLVAICLFIFALVGFVWVRIKK